MRTLYRYFVLLAITICGLAHSAWATHVRAGEITSRRISSTALTYELTLTIYCDWANGADATRNTAGSGVNFCFGDGTPVQNTPLFTQGLPNGGIVDVGNDTRRLIFKVIHTFNAPNTYTISVGIDNRNRGTINITNGNSEQYPFYVESTLAINSFLGLNSTPVMLNPPVDFNACVGQRYIHNPNAVDADGDSLAYRITQNKTTNVGESCRGFLVPSIVYPNQVPGCNAQNEAGTGAATYSINPVTGDLVWDAPRCVGQYNLAFVIEEWRNGIKIGEITRDMQITVRDCQNKRPTIEVPGDICIEAGKVVNFTVRGTDPDNNRVIISSTGAVYQQNPALITAPFATFTVPSTIQSSPGTGSFSWQTSCDHIRALPYEVLFKVADQPGSVQPYLVDSKTVNIRVVAPAPTNLQAVANGTAYNLTWAAYPCQVAGAEIVIYRKVGCTALTPNLCSPGPPPGYTEVARVPATQTSYTDNSTSLRPNTVYSYRIAVSFPGPNNLTRFSSTYSNESCQALPKQAIYITNVTVDETSTTAGQITVKWTRPEVTGTREYRIFRATGLNGTGYTRVGTITTNLSAPKTADTVFVDQGLNTEANAYRYRVDLYTTAGVRSDSSQAASSVRLSGTPQSRSVQLSWQANVPWSNDNQTHRVYRQVRPGVFNLIQQVAVTGSGSYTYTDNGRDNVTSDGDISTTLSPDSTYCYRVETVGSYNDNSIHPGLLYNFSQRLCLTPTDTTRPCPPVLSLNLLDCASYVQGTCEEAPFRNTLNWTDATTGPNGAACDPNIVHYNVYYKRYEDTGDFAKIGEVPFPSRIYLHENLSSYAGCYYVTTVNRFGVESLPSNTVCKDNCPDFTLPNVITPNNDGKNDTFAPIRCPRFVKEVRFRVFNRWGVKVYESNDNPLIQWDGRTDSGKELAAGTYYFEAQVRYERLNKAEEDRPVTLKSWVQIIR
ncbi:gliding motility-associated C-terminal domain-containing protein [Siphonobacter sp. SORGH_AS_1065]|uniref:T9SS type B sorting domain-containing protein n=1 Tax=Siphonobacter sp. SORGH_AS_1065 TaxID=3041795 RepID=UPI0027852BAF|nr:gliding motility-associated C-terminal domain-containing protein [Siphonobacter sp. SORGH_AS_1065]MDQ1085861.1 gliding motility-associated-like protein [Siphonobacter sp. SORGH_AS_1065]